MNIGNQLAIGLIGLLLSLIGTGIVSMISLYTNQAALTQQVKATSEAIQRHLDHSVDKDDYIRRDKEIQGAIDKMATKDELRDLRQSLDGQTQVLRDLQTTMVSNAAHQSSKR
jgi:hypothetical protein